MTASFPPFHPRCTFILHGGDYNPDQWPPDIWDQDMRLLQLAHVNALTVGVFAWSRIEPEEGRYDFAWLDTILDKIHHAGAVAILSTPTAAQPAWMSQRYPEVLRVTPDRRRILHGNRVNYCPTSPVFREKCRLVVEHLARRYHDHPALVLWHVSNEYGNLPVDGGSCYCPLCLEAFRAWLRRKYQTLDNLNDKWSADVWSHRFTDWSQIDAPGQPLGDWTLTALLLDWRRFVTDQVVDLMKNETDVLRRLSPGIPLTTNMMQNLYPSLNYWKFAPELDVISWNSYPLYHQRDDDLRLAAWIALQHDVFRSMKQGRPFLLMESSPGPASWMPVMRQKRPGQLRTESLQAVAHGADSVLYFQFRKARGGCEKFHAAVVDHAGHENTRMFREVAELGRTLEKLQPLVGTTVKPQVALLYDWENYWALNTDRQASHKSKDLQALTLSHYEPFWSRGVPVDILDYQQPFSDYSLVIAPMLYLLTSAMADRIRAYVAAGGIFVTTFITGIADEFDRCHLGGFPGPLRDVAGIWAEEADELYPDEINHVVMQEKNSLGLAGIYEVSHICELLHAESAEVLARYQSDYLKDVPALTVNNYQKGRCYYFGCGIENVLLHDIYQRLITELRLTRVLNSDLPSGVTAQMRSDEKFDYIFLFNFKPQNQIVKLDNRQYIDMMDHKPLTQTLSLNPFDTRILRRPRA